MQSALNNATNLNSTGRSPNELLYGFKPSEVVDLLGTNIQDDVDKKRESMRHDATDALALAAMHTKFHYDRRHRELFLRKGDWVNIRLHRGYTLPGIAHKKTAQQFVGPFQVAERVGRLAYRLHLPSNWKIHPVLSIAHLEAVPDPKTDPFHRTRPDHPGEVEVESKEEGHYEIERILN
jgi:hypothetical protein